MKGLYLVTPDWDDTEKMLAVTEAGLRGGAVLVQYRHKTAQSALRREQASALLALCRRHGIPLIINDHVDLCMEIDADGIHVGGTDREVNAVRMAVGADKIVGASCYGSIELAQAAYEKGASYVAFGGFYPSRVKKYEVTTPLSIVSQSKALIDLPVVVIGGMTQENAAPLVQQGADLVAVISSVYMSEQPASAAEGFSKLFEV